MMSFLSGKQKHRPVKLTLLMLLMLFPNQKIDASLPESCALLTCGPHHLRQYLYPIARRLKVHLNDKYTRYFDLLKEFDRHQSLVQLKTMQEAAAATTYCCWQPAPAAASFAATCCDICAAVDPTMYLAQVPLLDRHGSGLISGEPSEQSHPPAGQQQQQQHQAGRNWRLEEILKCKYIWRPYLSANSLFLIMMAAASNTPISLDH